MGRGNLGGSKAVDEPWKPRKGRGRRLVQGGFLEEAGFELGQWDKASSVARTQALP